MSSMSSMSSMSCMSSMSSMSSMYLVAAEDHHVPFKEVHETQRERLRRHTEHQLRRGSHLGDHFGWEKKRRAKRRAEEEGDGDVGVQKTGRGGGRGGMSGWKRERTVCVRTHVCMCVCVYVCRASGCFSPPLPHTLSLPNSLPIGLNTTPKNTSLNTHPRRSLIPQPRRH